MYADTLEELHSLAKQIGLKRDWFQNKAHLPHYDLVATKRKAAVDAGAVEHTKEQMVQFMRSRRGAAPIGSIARDEVADALPVQQGLFGS